MIIAMTIQMWGNVWSWTGWITLAMVSGSYIILIPKLIVSHLGM